MIRDAIAVALGGADLSCSQAERVIHEIMSGEATESQIGAFLTALQVKGPAADEITAFARTMRASAIPFCPPVPGMAIDTCGTGGDNSRSFNISTDCRICSCRCRGACCQTREPECIRKVWIGRCA